MVKLHNYKLCKYCVDPAFITWVLKKQKNIPKYIAINIINMIGECYKINVRGNYTARRKIVCNPKWIFRYRHPFNPLIAADAIRAYKNVVRQISSGIKKHYNNIEMINNAIYLIIAHTVLYRIKTCQNSMRRERMHIISDIMCHFSPLNYNLNLDAFLLSAYLDIRIVDYIYFDGYVRFPLFKSIL